MVSKASCLIIFTISLGVKSSTPESPEGFAVPGEPAALPASAAPATGRRGVQASRTRRCLPGALQSAHSSAFRRRLDILGSGADVLGEGEGGEKGSALPWPLGHADHWCNLQGRPRRQLNELIMNPEEKPLLLRPLVLSSSSLSPPPFQLTFALRALQRHRIRRGGQQWHSPVKCLP